MPVQKISPQVQQKLNALPAPLLNTLFDLAKFHQFTPGDDMSKQIQGVKQGLANASEPGTQSLYQDHLNALTNFQNYLYGNAPYDASGASIFDAAPQQQGK